MSEAPDNLEYLLSKLDTISLPRRGDLLTGLVIALDPKGAVVDLGLKRDGIIPVADLDSLPTEETNLRIGDELSVMVVEPEDPEGNLLVSVSQARESGDWLKARRLMEEDKILEATPCAKNRGGLIVPFGCLRGFVPASHISDMPRGLDEAGRLDYLESLVGRNLPFKVIEVDPRRRRLVLSERKAIRQWRLQQKGKLIEELKEGEVRKGVVTSLREFGAFVDIGGADGLIHISELSWRHVEDLGEMLTVGQEIETMVIGLDRNDKRIGLSLKRLQPNPWHEAEGQIAPGQTLDGTVSRLKSASAVVFLPGGLEGLMHVSEDVPTPSPGSTVRVRVTRFDAQKERLDLEWVAEGGALTELAEVSEP
jgi:small subunit ribosomal protein S1